MGKQLRIFVNSIFFAAGFSLVFAAFGIALVTFLDSSGFLLRRWAGYLGGLVIVVLGLNLMGVVSIPFLERDRRIRFSRRFRYSNVTSFVLGAVFAVGWTPCIGSVLGGILTFAINVSAFSAFWLLLSYSLGLGIPFILVGAFTAKASVLIGKAGGKLEYASKASGALLVLLGLFVFTNSIGRLANFRFLNVFMENPVFDIYFDPGSVAVLIGMGISLVAGVLSFLSPCILPLVPGYLTYISSEAIKETGKDEKDK